METSLSVQRLKKISILNRDVDSNVILVRFRLQDKNTMKWAFEYSDSGSLSEIWVSERLCYIGFQVRIPVPDENQVLVK